MVLFSSLLLLPACGQYGDLYAPPPEVDPQDDQDNTTEIQQEQKD